MKIRRERNDCGGLSAGSYGRTDQPWRSQRSVEMKQAVHGWLSTYERLVKSQKFFSSYLTQEDLSRLGRNYILTGQYTEIYFPSKGVRYIAVNDNVDTINGENELAPFLNILNEMHARQTSKKVKAAMRTRFANGAHYGAYAPLGYVKDPDKKGHLLIDPETR